MSKDDAAGFVGDIPDAYDRGLGPVLFHDYAGDMAERVAGFQPSRVLEVAAGTGIVTRRLRDLLPRETLLVATDLNPPMLEVARAKFGPGEPIELRAADATSLAFADASFDALVCQFGVMFFPDKLASLREARRVLAPGGRYFFSVWDQQRHNRFAALAYETVASFFADRPPTFMNVPFGFFSLDAIKDLLAEAGFGAVEISIVPRQKLLENGDLFAQGLIFGSPLADQIRARGLNPEIVKSAVVAALAREFGPEPARLRLQAILFQAVRD